MLPATRFNEGTASRGKELKKTKNKNTVSALDVSGGTGNQGFRRADFSPLTGFQTGISIKDLTPFLKAGRKICTVFIYVSAQLLTSKRHWRRGGRGEGGEGRGGEGCVGREGD